jgi:chlorite dismutase
MSSDPRPEISLQPTEGWHCSHLFYRFDRARLRGLASGELSQGASTFCEALTPSNSDSPTRLQSFVVAGHKADFGLTALDPDPLKIDRVHQRLMSSPLGPALEAVWSFVSMTEVSEYLPDRERFGQRLETEGLEPASEEYRERLAQYEKRLEIMRRQRLTPDLPAWPSMCFYPMSKRRRQGANWYAADFEHRERLMAEHGETGMKYAGKVTQLVTVALGLDDWEWGVTLWARNPQWLKDIVYRMRFDEASARFAEFGPFYVGYLMPPAEILQHCRVDRHEQ